MAEDRQAGASGVASRGWRGARVAGCFAAAVAVGAGGAGQYEAATAAPVQAPATGLEGLCTPEGVQAVASTLPNGVTIKRVENGPFPAATRYVAAVGKTPAYCQVTGSFVTNPATGKTANFLATFPETWNGKYLQLGCSGHCGQFYVNNPALPPITVTAQGYATQIIDKGYAAIATDEGHVGLDGGKWAIRKDGSVDRDYVDDYLYRAQLVLSDLGKAFTTAFYSRANGQPAKLTRSYFNGCSGGGRDALVAASYFPEKFDGIIAGSAYNPIGVGIHSSGLGLLGKQTKGSVPSALLAQMDAVVKRQCDAVDGVADGVIQNPAACNFRPERDLPKCDGDTPGAQCFTKAQINMLSAVVTAVTDDRGTILQPGYSVSELQVGASVGLSGLGDATQKIFAHNNDQSFDIASSYAFRDGGPGRVTGFRAIYSAKEAAFLTAAIRRGAGHLPENTRRLMSGRTKLLMWHNWSDEALTPYMSVNWYKGLAARNGGYAKVQDKVRLFMLPATSHCSISGIGPNSFDALGSLENWVERKQAPDALTASVAARQFAPGAPPAAALKYPNWTQKLCKFPEMARYSGSGDVKDAANWSCSPGDKRMLTVGETGRQAGAS